MTRLDRLLKLLEEYDSLVAVAFTHYCVGQDCRKMLAYLRKEKDQLRQELIEHGYRRKAKMKYKRYAKVITKESGSLCAIYEPHPFRSSAISEAVGSKVNTGIADDEWAWTYYDWCCNPIGIDYVKPEGIEVDKFTTENLDFSWTTPECAQKLCDYLNMEPYGEEN